MQIQGQIQEADYMSAQSLHRHKLSFLILPLILVASLLELLLFFVDELNPFVVALLVVLTTFYFFYLPYLHKRHYRQYKALSESVTVEVRDDGLFFKRINSEALVPWSHITKWRHNKKLVLLYPVGNAFYIIPSHFFSSPEEFQTFLTVLKTQLVKIL
jgi:hypothetical protein